MKKEQKQGLIIIGIALCILIIWYWSQLSSQNRFEEKTISTYRIERGIK